MKSRRSTTFSLVLLFSCCSLHPDFTGQPTIEELGGLRTQSITTFHTPNHPTSSIEMKQFDSLEDCFTYANECYAQNNIEEAISYYTKALEFNPEASAIHFNLGVCYYKLQQEQNALDAFNKTIIYAPEHAKAHYNMSKIYEKRSMHEKALPHMLKALEYGTQNAEAYHSTAKMYVQKDDFEHALTYIEKAHELAPNHAQIMFEYANVLNSLNRMEDALEVYYHVLERNPENATVLYNVAYTLKKIGRIDDAIRFYKRSLELSPNNTNTKFSLALTYIANGNWDLGWPLYELRHDNDANNRRRVYPQPRWDGSDLRGKTIFLYAEQGLGDTFQFIRFARVAKERGARVIVAVQPPLLTIAKLQPYIDQVISIYDNPPAFDVHAPLMSMPFILSVTEETVPKKTPYLQADERLVQEWKQKLSSDKNFKIAINWEGNNKQISPYLRALVKKRTLQAEQFKPLSEIPGVRLYSLQKMVASDQKTSFHINRFDDTFDQAHGRFMDTAAVMKNMDLIITNDTSIAHLAGGLGLNVWTLLPQPADWRWMFNRLDTPWYPNMRLFRQFAADDWDSLIQHVAHEVMPLVTQKIRTLPTQQIPDASELISPSSIVTDLKREQHTIARKLKQVGTELQMLNSVEPTDTTFINKAKRFYALSQLYDAIQEKIDACCS